MKNIIIAAFIIAIGLVGCSVSQPGERDYYPPQPGYTTTYGYYDPYYSPPVIYDNGYNGYYDRRYGYNNAPVYVVPAPNRTYRRDRNYNQQREQYREQQYRQQQQNREQYRQQQGTTTQPSPSYQQSERRLPDGSRVSPDGSITLPNGQVRRKQ